jgi:hypothetical protein
MYLMNKVFLEYLDKFVMVFTDDILVYYKSEEEHEKYLHLLLQKLQDHMLYVSWASASFGWNKLLSWVM